MTACNADGDLLSYAAKGNGTLNLLRTLSTEFPRLDSATAVSDPWLRPDPEVALQPTGSEMPMPPQAIIAPDVPGPFGYNAQPCQDIPGSDEPWFEIGSLFTRFSGRSAATALAAGLASLAIAQTLGQDDTIGIKVPEEIPEAIATTLFNFNAAESWLKGQARRA